ncbi:glycerophosphodiester phosphodiesterase [Ktedonospora formicarum]|uniref:Glycerophosphodiester phosphodiesterase n=1 Tax=Ktedonospora formicarum TaxID=2778364 RepID=A0A8J3MSL8_9CHLR|nr:glycerophosphodiester phosphodiesterase [Ktedonospora formicarum]GHO46255.1 glycerophosphodiester phosphodiesterase [Ktedonospora formicarum]
MPQAPDTEKPSVAKRAKMPRWRKVILVLLAIIAIVFLIHEVFYYFFVPTQTPIFTDVKTPLLIAHQGGELLAPSDTMAAFAKADSIGVDMLETDIHMTKDGYLVLIHDNTVDRTTNGKGRVDSYTLSDLKKLDAGYRFKDLAGQYSYRGKGVTIPTLEELLQAYGQKYLYNLEMKDAYPINGPSQIEAKLWGLIQKYHVEKRVVVTSFHQELIDHFDQLAHGQVALGAGTTEVTKFVLTHKFWVPGFYRPTANVFQIPTENSGFNLKDRALIEGAHRLHIQVHYWTIDDKATMKELLQLGADGIITNRPDLLKEVLQEMHLR